MAVFFPKYEGYCKGFVLVEMKFRTTRVSEPVKNFLFVFGNGCILDSVLIFPFPLEDYKLYVVCASQFKV